MHDKIKQLLVLKQRAGALEAAVAAERTHALASLPNKYGFNSVDEFITAVRAAGGTSGAPRGRKASSGGPKPTKRKRRMKITDETRAEVKKLVRAGKTGAQIAEQVGISLPSVQNIKKALGLVKKQK
jgi:DNA-binding NarL/FixJ family response regulator